MADPITTPTFPTLLQRFFVEHLGHQRAVSPRTIAAYRDTFRLLLSFAEASIGKAPTALALVDLDARLILDFLDHLEKERNNGARSRNARLAALRSFLKYAAHYDLTALPVIEQALAILGGVCPVTQMKNTGDYNHPVQIARLLPPTPA
mgnify:CR=1 FL=1